MTKRQKIFATEAGQTNTEAYSVVGNVQDVRAPYASTHLCPGGVAERRPDGGECVDG